MKFINLTTGSGTSIRLNPAHIVGYSGSGSTSTKVTLTSLNGHGANHTEYVTETPRQIDDLLAGLP